MRTLLLAAAVVLVAGLALALGPGRPVHADAVRITASTRGDSGRLTLMWPRPIAFEATSDKGAFVLRFDRPVEADFTRAVSALSRFVGQPHIADDSRTLTFSLRPGVVALTLADGKRVVVDLFASADEEDSEPGAQTPSQAVEGATEPSDAPTAITMMRPVPAPNRRPRLDSSPQSPVAEDIAGGAAVATGQDAGMPTEASHPVATLRFDWTEPVAAVVFRRGETLWIAFDRSSVQDLATLRQDGGQLVRSIQQLAHPRATVLRMEVSANANPIVSRDALSWIVTLSSDPPPPALAITPLMHTDPDGRHRLVLPVAEPGAPLGLTDPELGDSLVLVPTVPLGAGLNRSRTYPQVRLLASSQGLVVRPLVDDLRVHAGREAVEVTTANGLSLTPVDDASVARAQLRAIAGDAHVIGLTGGSPLSLERFTPIRQEIGAALAASDDDVEREHLRLRLARHYLAYGFAAEALAAAQGAERDRAGLADEAPFLALRAAALVLLGRDNEAASDLAHPSLARSVEAAAWRTALQTEPSRPGVDEATLPLQAAVVAGYPRILRAVLLPRLAEAAIDAGDPSLSAKLVGAVAAEARSAEDEAQADFLDGRRLAANGDVTGALEAWRAVEDGPDSGRRSRVRAAQARVALALAEKRMDEDEAIESLDRLDFAWRGDALEFSVLDRLGDLYLDRKNYTAALRTLRRAATNFPTAAREAEIPSRMSHAFAALFIGDDADRRRPLEAIALYDEFRELTPAGARGDAVIAAVAERMVALDLLGRAAALLDAQVRYRLTGPERAKAGARLAAIHLLDDKPKAALKALRLTADASLASALSHERQMIEARALARLDRTEEALSRLDGIETAEAAAIRADIYWAMKDWRRAAGSIAKVLKTPGKADDDDNPDKETDRSAAEKRADSTLHLAVALALAGKETELVDLGSTRGDQMAESRWRDVFPLITGKTMAEADLRALAGDLAPVDRFRAHLSRDTAEQ